MYLPPLVFVIMPLRLCSVLQSTGLARREKGISDSRVVTTAPNSHKGNEGRQLSSQLHAIFGQNNWMFRTEEGFSSENVFVFYMSCVTSSEGAVLGHCRMSQWN